MRLNAFVDGELALAERAEIAARIASDRDFARAHATLARLKACVTEGADQASPIVMNTAARKPARTAVALAAGAAAILLVSIAAWNVMQPRREAAPSIKHDEIIKLAALPVRPVIPDFAAAGLKLSGVNIRRADTVVATYTGPRGCRLELRIRSKDSPAVAGSGSSERDWVVGSLAYQLVAFGMPPTRFAIIAGAAERQTRLLADPANTAPLLREARIAAPPCLG